MSYHYLLDLALILLSTKLLGIATGKFQMPRVVGALLAGLILGPAALNILSETAFLTQLSELGVIVILFTAGMGTDLRELRSAGKAGFLVALCGVLVPMFMGTGFGWLAGRMGWLLENTFLENIFLGTVLTATSVSITVETLMELSSIPLPARRAMDSGELVVERDASDLCGPPSHRNRAFIAAPLTCGEERIGALLFCVPQGPNLILEADCRTAEGLARLFSSMLEVGELQHQIQMRQQAELRALQSQIDPHFLFNALSTISALCTTDPKKARETILTLAGYFRQALSINEPFVSLEQELSNIRNYLALTEARFQDAIHVAWDLPDVLPVLYLPPLILQPVVENAVRHGRTSVDDRHVRISIRQENERVDIRISDRGHGFPEEILSWLQDPRDPGYTGLFNVQKRLRSVYGGQCGFTVDSSERGSTVTISIPLMPPGGLKSKQEGSMAYAYRSD